MSSSRIFIWKKALQSCHCSGKGKEATTEVENFAGKSWHALTYLVKCRKYISHRHVALLSVINGIHVRINAHGDSKRFHSSSRVFMNAIITSSLSLHYDHYATTAYRIDKTHLLTIHVCPVQKSSTGHWRSLVADMDCCMKSDVNRIIVVFTKSQRVEYKCLMSIMGSIHQMFPYSLCQYRRSHRGRS